MKSFVAIAVLSFLVAGRGAASSSHASPPISPSGTRRLRTRAVYRSGAGSVRGGDGTAGSRELQGDDAVVVGGFSVPAADLPPIVAKPIMAGPDESSPPFVVARPPEDFAAGKCNAQDMETWIADGGDATRGEKSNYCSREYENGGCLLDSDCIEVCFQEVHGYSEECSTCFGALPACSIRNGCMMACAADSLGPECSECNAPCTEELRACTGLPSVEDALGLEGEARPPIGPVLMQPIMAGPEDDGSPPSFNAISFEAEDVEDSADGILGLDLPATVAIWYGRSDGWDGTSYAEAVEFCAELRAGFDLCPYEALCPDGTGTMPLGGCRDDPERDGSWVPVLASTTGDEDPWVQVSEYSTLFDGSPSCTVEKSPKFLGGGDDEKRERQTRHLACCLTKEALIPVLPLAPGPVIITDSPEEPYDPFLGMGSMSLPTEASEEPTPSPASDPTYAPGTALTEPPVPTGPPCGFCPLGLTMNDGTLIPILDDTTCGEAMDLALDFYDADEGCYRLKEAQSACCPAAPAVPCGYCAETDGITVDGGTIVPGADGTTCATAALIAAASESAGEECGKIVATESTCCPIDDGAWLGVECCDPELGPGPCPDEDGNYDNCIDEGSLCCGDGNWYGDPDLGGGGCEIFGLRDSQACATSELAPSGGSSSESKCCDPELGPGGCPDEDGSFDNCWDEGGYCCGDGEWYADPGDGSGNCLDKGLEDSRACATTSEPPTVAPSKSPTKGPTNSPIEDTPSTPAPEDSSDASGGPTVSPSALAPTKMPQAAPVPAREGAPPSSAAATGASFLAAAIAVVAGLHYL